MNVDYVGRLVRAQRKKAGLNQTDLEMVSRTGRRFISDLENGKETCQIGKAMIVLEGFDIDLVAKSRNGEEVGGDRISRR